MVETSDRKKQIKAVLRRIYIGKSERVGIRQVLRLLILSTFTVSITMTLFNSGNVQTSTQSPIETSSSEKPVIEQDNLQVSEDLVSQQSELKANLGKVSSGFTSSELKQFKSVRTDLQAYSAAGLAKNIADLNRMCVKLKKTDESLLPIHQRVNNMNVVPEKYDQYWGLGSYFLFEGNLQCGKVTPSTLGLLEEKKISFFYERSEYYFNKIINEGSADKLPNQVALDKALLKESVTEEDAFFAGIEAKFKPYFEKNAGLSKEEIDLLERFRPQLVNYINAVKTTNLVTIASACGNLGRSYESLRGTESDSTVYESYLDRVKDYTYSGISDCEKGFKKNRINLLITADSDFKSALTFLDALVKFSKQLK